MTIITQAMNFTPKRRLTGQELGLYLGQRATLLRTHFMQRAPQEYDSIDIHIHTSEKCTLVPHLRPLSTMTVDEFHQVFGATGTRYAESYVKNAIASISKSLHGLHQCIANIGDFQAVPKLLAMGFDLFNWINDGLAIPNNPTTE